MDDPEPGDLGATPLAELIQRLAGGAACDEAARAALGEFYRRFAEGLFAHCAKRYGRQLGGPDENRCFVGAVFIRFRSYAQRFDPQVARSPAGLPKLVRCWLARQAAWAIGEWMTAAENKAAAHVDVDLVGLPAPARIERRSPAFVRNLRRLRTVLRSMPAKDQDIIRTSYRYHDTEADEFRLPGHVQDDLCARWGFASRNALVKYRSRKLDEFRDQVRATSHVA